MKTEKDMKTGKYGLLAAGFVLLLAASCTRYEETAPANRPGEPVNVKFSAKVGSLSAGDEATYSLFQTDESQPLTRIIPDGMVDNENALIKNLWVIQFEDGIGGDVGSKKMVGVPRFISSEDLDGQNGTVQLIGTTNPCYIIWIANHPLGADFRWNLPLNATFANVAAKMMQISSEADTWPTIEGTPTIMMNAITETPVLDLAGTDFEPVFSRNYARVSLKLTMGVAGYKILSVRLRNVPTSITLSELSLGTAYSGIVQSGTAIYPYGSPLIDYPAVAPAMGELDDPDESRTFTWYVPRNQQGTSMSPSVDYKNYYAPNDATYFEVVAQRTDNPETAVFRVYPGANQTDDYNLLPNHAYTSSLVVKGIGSSDTPDSRINNFDDVGYTEAEAANCYILNPAPAGGRTRKYSIPITHAITYWSGTLDGYGNDPNNVIKNNDPWQISVLWSENYAASSQITFDNGGAGTGPNDRFTLNVPAGLPECNFTVQLTRNGSNVVLWSWHFWVTDYNPDAFRFFALDRNKVNPDGVPNGTFTYPVPNGQVERYSGDVWTTGVYKEKVMMDRPIGAMKNYFTEQPVCTTSYATTTPGHLFYQFGRKDPFPLVQATAGVAQLSYGSVRYRMSTELPAYNNPVPQVQSVLNPTLYYTKVSAGTWCSDVDGFTLPRFVWHDPNTPINSVGVGVEYSGKSIHDPCPPGWKVPIRGTFDDFALDVTANNATRDLGWDGGRGLSNVKALRYWPGTVEAPVGGTIYFATSGQRVGASGSPGNVGAGAYSWMAVPYSSTSGCGFNSTINSMNTAGGPHRSIGYPVRCVSE